MIKAIRIAGVWYFPNIEQIKVWQSSGIVSINAYESPSGYGTTLYMQSENDNTKGQYGIADVTKITFANGKIWLCISTYAVNFGAQQGYVTLDSILNNVHCELVMGGVNSPTIYLLPPLKEVAA